MSGELHVSNDNELNQRLFQSSDDNPLGFQPIGSRLVARVHETKVIDRQYLAWVGLVLANRSGSDVDDYLAATVR